MDANIIAELSSIIRDTLRHFGYSDSILMIPFGVNIVAFLLNVETLVRYGKNNKMFAWSSIILCLLLFILYRLNMSITASSEVTDGRIVAISIGLVVLGVIFSLSPFWVLNKNNLEK